MKKVITAGVFDLFHIGHFNILKKASEQGDYLIVGVHIDDLKTKGIDFLYSIEERVALLSALRFVNEVIPYEKLNELLESTDFDVFVHGPDKYSDTFTKSFAYCKKFNKEVIEIPRTKGISSTVIRQFICNCNFN